MNSIKNWFTRPAYWYEFWHPGSGFIGGTILFWLILTVSFAVYTIFC